MSTNQSHPTVVVTGATGAVGGQVARILGSSDVRQRLLARSPDRLPQVDGAEPYRFTGYTDRVGGAKALRGADTLFMVSAEEAADRLDHHRALIDVAVAAGVQHIVYTSFYGAGPDCTFTLGRDHFATEEHIRRSGVDFTFLRDNFYLDVLPLFADEQGVIRGPAGQGRLSGVARDDVAACAAEILADPGAHVGATYDLTGREELTLDEAAAVIAAVQGREVRFQDETLEEAYASRRQWDAEPWQYDAWVSTYTAIAHGECAGLSDDVHRLVGRQPMTLAELLATA